MGKEKDNPNVLDSTGETKRGGIDGMKVDRFMKKQKSRKNK